MQFLSLVNTVDVWLAKSNNSYRNIFQALFLAMALLVIFNSACYWMDFRISPHVNSNCIRLIYFVLIFVGGFAMFRFIFSVLLLKVRFEILDKELLSVLNTLQEELTMAESVIRPQTSELSNADTGKLHDAARHVPQNHITIVQQLDLDTSDTLFHDLSISKQCKVPRLRGIDNGL
jgi:predicted PurR-regulated permease PerM